MRFFYLLKFILTFLLVNCLISCKQSWAKNDCSSLYATDSAIHNLTISQMANEIGSNFLIEKAVFYPNGVVVVPGYKNGKIEMVKIFSPDVNDRRVNEFYRVTLPLSEYKIPSDIRNSLLEGLFEGKVLDVGTGEGTAVFDMRAAGIDAEGVDIILNDHQRTLPFFHQADMAEMTDIMDNSVRLTISHFSFWTYSLTRYTSDIHYDQGQKILSEFRRITEPHGLIILGGTPSRDVENIVKSIPGLKIICEGTTGVPWTLIIKTP